MASIIRKLFSAITMFQLILLIFFIVANIDSLEAIEFPMTVNETTYNISFNFYTVLAVIGILFAVMILGSLTIFGSGFNEEGSRNISKYLSIIGMLTILGVAASYYILQFGVFGLMVEMLFAVVYLFYVLEMAQTQNISGV